MLHYILQIIAFQLLFLVVYDFFLKKETFFRWNRFYLLLTPVLSLVLPLVKIPVLSQSIPDGYKIQLPQLLLGDTRPEAIVDGGVLPEVVVTGASYFNAYTLLLNLWYVGMVVAFLLFAVKLYKIWTLKKAGTQTTLNGLRMVSIPESTSAFSFFNTVFLGKDLNEKQYESILRHELVHIKEKHSLDLLFFEMQRIVFWFNPLVYLYQNSMILLQEYTADAKAVAQTDKKGYYQSLLEQVFQTQKISFINTFFNHSFIKKRIIMLQKSKSNQLARLKYVLLIPVVCSMLFYVACSEDNSREVINQSSIENQIIDLKEQLITEDEVTQEEYEEYLELVKEMIRLKNESNIEVTGSDFELVRDYLDKPKNKLIYQTSGGEKVEVDEVPIGELENIPFAVIEKVPTYPGCSGSNEELKKCMSDKISTHIGENFNFDIKENLDLEDGAHRIFVAFRIDKRGNVTNLRSRAPRPELADEAERVLGSLPKMEPGEQGGRPVGVLYSLPITFNIAD